MNDKQKLGKQGERAAAEYLIRKGYRIIKFNYRCRVGEIDIVAVKDEILVFCEVKTRTGNSFGSPAEAVTREKLIHIKKAAEWFLASGNWYRYQPRVDVIEITIGTETIINHMICVT